MKKMYLIAGANGAGKSTLYSANEMEDEVQKSKRINTDEIVRKFGSWKNNIHQIQAARMAVKMRNDYFAKKESFNEETTFCGKTILKQIDRAKALGYKVHLYYIGVSSVEILKERIKNRVSKGGHYVSDELVEKRYVESIENLENMIHKFDYINIYDNSSFFRLCYKFSKDDGLYYISKQIPDWL